MAWLCATSPATDVRSELPRRVERHLGPAVVPHLSEGRLLAGPTLACRSVARTREWCLVVRVPDHGRGSGGSRLVTAWCARRRGPGGSAGSARPVDARRPRARRGVRQHLLDGDLRANIAARVDGRLLAVVLGVLATMQALLFDITAYEAFLDLIGAVLVPLVGVFVRYLLPPAARRLGRVGDRPRTPVAAAAVGGWLGTVGRRSSDGRPATRRQHAGSPSRRGRSAGGRPEYRPMFRRARCGGGGQRRRPRRRRAGAGRPTCCEPPNHGRSSTRPRGC